MASTKKPTTPSNPAGLSEKDVAAIFEDLVMSWSDARARYEARTKAPDLDFTEFVRWTIDHRPSVPLEWALDFLQASTREGLAPLSQDEAVSLVGRLDLKPDGEGGLESPGEAGILGAFGSYFALDFSPFRALFQERLDRGEWPPDVCHAFWEAAWLLGEDVPEGEARYLGRQHAEEHYRSFTSTPRYVPRHLAPLIRRAGLGERDDRALGIALLGMDGWRAALAEIIAREPDWTFERVADAFDEVPLAAAVPRLVEGDRTRDPRLTQAYVDHLRARPEPAAELLAVGRRLAGQEPRPRLAELFLLEAARRLLDGGEPVPEDIESLLQLNLTDRGPLTLYRAVLPRLPRARRLAILERDLADRESRGVGIVALTDDEIERGSALLGRALAHPRFDPVAMGQLGGRGAAVIAALLDTKIDPSMRPRLEGALIEAAATHVMAGGAFDEAWGFYLVLAPPYSDAVIALFDHLPEPLRSDLLIEAVRESRQPLGVLDVMIRRGLREEAIDPFVEAFRRRERTACWPPLPGRLAVLSTEGRSEDAFAPDLQRFRELSARAPGPKEPIYVLQTVPERFARPATTLTSFGGQPPVAVKDRPRSSRHFLTIDVRDAPEIASRFPGARAASLFVPREPDLDEDDPDDYFWRAWTEAQVAPALAAIERRRSTLVVHRCEVSKSTFTKSGDNALRAALIQLPGYLLGGPITIQQDTAENHPSFMAQLSDDFDLPLGDSGRLYSYVDEARWDGC